MFILGGIECYTQKLSIISIQVSNGPKVNKGTLCINTDAGPGHNDK